LALRYPDLQRAYKAYYTESVKGGGYIMGTATRGINTWDGCIVQPFAYGDGTTVIDNNQNATFLIYNVKDGTVFRLRDAIGARFSAMGQSDKQSMGNIVEDQHEVTLSRAFTIGAKVYSGSVTVQQATNGCFIADATDNNWLFGYEWSETAGYFTTFPAPSVSGDYGTFLDRVRDGDKYYINYTKGCVLAQDNAIGTGYTFVYNPGRNFNMATKQVYLLSMDLFISKSLLSIDPADRSIFGAKTDDEIKQMFINAYKRYYDKGYFLGSLESTIKGWNNVIGQQFKTGDSIAKPWGDGRANIAFLAYNPTADDVFVVTDGGLTAFDAAGNGNNAYGAPLEDAAAYPDLGISVQRFTRTSGSGLNSCNVFLVYNGRNAYLFDNASRQALGIEGTAEKNVFELFLDWYATTNRTATHERDVSKGYIGEGAVPYNSIALTVGGIGETA
jgi:hypothetical protein